MKVLHHLIYFLIVLLVTGCSSERTIIHGVDERDANNIIVLLNGKNIPAIKVQSTVSTGAGGQGGPVLWDIEVPEDKRIIAMSYIEQAGLPKSNGENLLQIFSNTGLVPSATQEKIRYEAGLSQQIANTIDQIDGVIDAKVIISFPEIDPLTGNPSGPITASVFVKHNGVLNDPNLHLVTKIRKLVAASVTGLSYDNVTVIGERMQAPIETDIQLVNQVPMVDVWTMQMTAGSLSTFRFIVFSLIVIIIIMIMLFSWMIWKLHKLLKKCSFRDIFIIKPIEIGEDKPQLKEKKEEGAPELKEDKKQGVDPDI